MFRGTLQQILKDFSIELDNFFFKRIICDFFLEISKFVQRSDECLFPNAGAETALVPCILMFICATEIEER